MQRLHSQMPQEPKYPPGSLLQHGKCAVLFSDGSLKAERHPYAVTHRISFQRSFPVRKNVPKSDQAYEPRHVCPSVKGLEPPTPSLGNWCSILLSYTDMYNRFPPSRRIFPLSGTDFYLTIFAPCLQVRIRSKHALNGSCGLPGGNAADRADRDAAGVLFYVFKLSGAA